jgi:hypothetical protein
MKRGIATATIALVSVCAAIAAVRPAEARADVGPGVADLLAQRGFGDPGNSYAWSMAWFRGRLYVGTARQVACVEKATIDRYFPRLARYKTNPYPGVRCPRDRYDMNLRAEVWQYTPRTGRWRRVYRSPADIPNPRAPGKFVARDIAFRGMAVYRDAHGRKRLYIGGVTADQFIPELSGKHPPRILSTRDGRHFRATPARNVLVRTPHGVDRPIGFRAMTVWRGRLFVTATPGLTGDGAVFEVRRPWSRRARFKQVTPSNLAVFEMEPFNRSLYLGTGSHDDGYGVWRMTAKPLHARAAACHRSGGRRRHRGCRRLVPLRYRVKPIVTGGAGRGYVITSVVSMHVFRHRLYVGASGWYNPSEIPLSEMIRIDRRGRWQVVVGATRNVNGIPKGPISGLSDGFYNIFAAHFWRMADYKGALYAGTNDWSWLVQMGFPHLNPSYLAGVVQSVLAGEYGFDLWASCDGRDWFPVTRDAFGGNMYDFGARNFVSTKGGLFVGSANHAQGTKVWRDRVGACSSLVRGAGNGLRAASAGVTAPQGVLTDQQRAGTVLSWRDSAGATRYRVFRASYLSVPLNIAPPPVMPNGFLPEDQVPDIVAPGTPGAKEVDLPVLQGFTPLATTRGNVYVDRNATQGTRYAYRVVAVGASGQQSPPSTMQMAPDPRPAATFKQVRHEVGGATPAARLVSAAVARNRRGDRAAALRMLARARRSLGADSDPGDLIARLERHIRFAGLAPGH